MASKGTVASTYVALFLCLNMLSYTMVSSTYNIPVIPDPSVPYQKGTCPIDALKLGVCANVLNLVNVKLGSPPTLPCCNLIKGLADLEVAACLCTALKANVLGINLNVPISLSVILNNCGRNNAGFQCPWILYCWSISTYSTCCWWSLSCIFHISLWLIFSFQFMLCCMYYCYFLALAILISHSFNICSTDGGLLIILVSIFDCICKSCGINKIMWFLLISRIHLSFFKNLYRYIYDIPFLFNLS